MSYQPHVIVRVRRCVCPRACATECVRACVSVTGLVGGVDPDAADGVGLLEEHDVVESLLDEPLEGVETVPAAAHDAHARLGPLGQQLGDRRVRTLLDRYLHGCLNTLLCVIITGREEGSINS